MSRYTRRMRRLGSGAACLLLVWASTALGARTSEVAQEGARTRQLDKRVVQVWWLPVEYWEAAARELGWPEEEIRVVRERFELYTFLGVIDARVGKDHQFEFRDHVHLAGRIGPIRDGGRVEALRSWDPVVTKRLPDLTYLLRGSLGAMRSGLRLLLYPNLDANGKPELSGAREGTLHVRYDIDEGPPLDFFWHGPFTAVAGPIRDKATDEAYDASWKFNPWTGEKLR